MRSALALLLPAVLFAACGDHPTGGSPAEPPGTVSHARMKAPMNAHHDCSALNDDVTQCVIYDGSAKARVVGVEYIVSARLVGAMPGT